MKASATITSGEINGPFHLAHTMRSGQLAEPEWSVEGDWFWDILRLHGGYAKCRIRQPGPSESPALDLELTGDALDEASIAEARAQIAALLRLRDDLPAFYSRFGEEFADAFREFRGLRLMKANDPFESLICCLCSQNSSVKQVNSTMAMIRRKFGTPVKFEDGSTAFAFPAAEGLAKASAAQLRSVRPLAYRAKYVRAAARMIDRGDLELEELRRDPYVEARERIMKVPGVGPKIADCFLLYGLGVDEAAPVDRWIHRIVAKLYFGGRKVSKEKAAGFLRERFGRWAGYAQVYLYHYARINKIV